jgi:hypothetical protein
LGLREEKRYMNNNNENGLGLGKLTAHDLATLREILLDVLDDGCQCCGPMPSDMKHHWEMFEGHVGNEGYIVTETQANEQRLLFVSAVVAEIVREAAPEATAKPSMLSRMASVR